MLFQLAIKADSTQLHIDCPQAGMRFVIKNSVAYDPIKHEIYEVGVDQNDLIPSGVEYLKQAGVEIAYRQPFNISIFDPNLAHAVVRFYAFMALAIARSAPPANMFPWFDPFELDLQIEHYRHLPLEQRQEFEHALRQMGVPRIRSVLVNNQSSLTPEFLKSKNRLQIKHNIADLAWGILFWGGSLGGLLLTVPPIYRTVAQAFNPPVDLLTAGLGFGLMAIIIAGIFTGIDLIASFAYALLLRPWLPADILRTVFLKASHALPKRTVNWLSVTLFADVPDTP